MQLSDFDVKVAFFVKEAFKRNLIILIGNLTALTGIELLAWSMALEEVSKEIQLNNLGTSFLLNQRLREAISDPDRL